MDKLKKQIDDLLQAAHLPLTELQVINESILKSYKLSIGNFLEIYPKEVDIYYVNPKGKFAYTDCNAQCLLDPRTNDEIWALQSNRFGKR